MTPLTAPSPTSFRVLFSSFPIYLVFLLFYFFSSLISIPARSITHFSSLLAPFFLNSGRDRVHNFYEKSSEIWQKGKINAWKTNGIGKDSVKVT